MIKCPGCGAGMRFDPAGQMLVCDHCQTKLTPEEADIRELHYNAADSEDYHAHLTSQKKTFDAVIYRCPNCGGELISTDETAVTFCSFCGSSVMLESRFSKQKAPSYIIPFKLTREECEEIYRRKVQSSFFVPSYMKEKTEIEKFRGIYMPYWVYELSKERTLHLRGSKEHRRGDYIYRTHYQIDKEVQGMYEGISYDAASDFSDMLSQGIAPYDTNETRPFHPAYMAGFYGDAGDVDSGVYEDEARLEAQNYFLEMTEMDKNLRGMEVKGIAEAVAPDGCREKMGYMPVWFLSVRSRDKKRVSYAAVNGQNGEIAADLPVSFWKYIVVSLILAVPIFLLMNIGLTLSPMKSLIVNLILSIIGFIIVNRQLNVTFTREQNLDDQGYVFAHRLDPKSMTSGGTSAKKKLPGNGKKDRGCLTAFLVLSGYMLVSGVFSGLIEIIDSLPQRYMDPAVKIILVFGAVIFVTAIVRMVINSGAGSKVRRQNYRFKVYSAPMAMKIGALMKPAAGVILSLIVYALNPAADYYYYGATVISLVLLAWSFYDIMEQHNRQTMRILPQFGKRGGGDAH